MRVEKNMKEAGMDRAGAEEMENANIASFGQMPTPASLRGELPLSAKGRATVAGGRRAIRSILDREDSRLLVVVGPCSIHDPEAGLDYARRLKGLQEELGESMLLTMRAYFEKPRTTSGWKGHINDPLMDDSFRIDVGMRSARRFLIELAELGLPAATEALDPISPQYLGDLISWTAIGARTTESQTHREMASGLSTPVGFKNGTDGGIDVAINAAVSASRAHAFLGVSEQGLVSIVRAKGNAYGHVVLRGGGGRPNYDSVSVAIAERAMERAGLRPNVVVDCSHANSDKNPRLQPRVMMDVVRQIQRGSGSIVGVMLESNLAEGSQPIPKDLRDLAYGKSVTDGCLGWEETASLLRQAHRELMSARKRGEAG